MNRGGLCQKGWTAPALLTTPDRLRSPLVRGPGGELAPAGWDEALDLIVAGLDRVRETYGPDGVGVFGGGGLTNEKAYALGKFARVALWHQPDRLQRPLSACPPPRPPATPPSDSTGACRSPSPTSATPTSSCWPEPTRRRPCPR
ncbi:Periplasmic nitrate reductase [Streptomyces microflavus]